MGEFCENTLNMKNKEYMLVNQTLLEELSNGGFFEKNDFYIYFVCSCPKIQIIPEKFKFIEHTAYFYFKIWNKDNYSIEELKWKFDEEISLTSKYPYNELTLTNQNHETHTNFSTLFYNKFAEKTLDFEVLYIGQSFGKDGCRNVDQRLLSHSTLQKIYSEILLNDPNKEIWLLLLSFDEPYQYILLTNKSKQMDSKNWVENRKAGNSIPLNQRINYTEAALINYFKPEYNEKFKENFPDPNHKSYTSCFEYNMDRIGFELITGPDFPINLYSKEIKSDYYHTGIYSLEDLKRKYMIFDYGNLLDK
ncbi:hypothetical protein MMKA1_03260 [Methanococcus maripaludis KA1]|uniref:Uncharacterized protein n=2 Tax=Methanococcus maripaludis TaxID=39152 RepID=A0A2Z5PEJ0_METMI|nr:hypothetical protein [Methanococcus maripaludis]AEK19215.1 hypothetical protein GYY_01640 [Methanococcus maripaludis X1]BAP60443.1 hypothetical protein MMKA1_03260 [Methanococcus maripaludis KA1]